MPDFTAEELRLIAAALGATRWNTLVNAASVKGRDNLSKAAGEIYLEMADRYEAVRCKITGEEPHLLMPGYRERERSSRL